VRLYCLPHAGGSAAVYRKWIGLAAEGGIALVPVEFPGRGTRFKEPAFDDVAMLARTFVDNVVGDSPISFGLFGHSAGAIAAAAIAVEMDRRHLPLRHLFVSGAIPPGAATSSMWHRLDHDDLIAELTSLGGTPDGVMSHPELMELLLPAVRADLTSAETAPTIRDRSLDCPVTAYSAEADPTAPHDLVSTWERVSSGPFSHRQFPGHHFYLQDHWQQLVDDMSDRLL
jgi:surfactin synthase thioesterase subunit